MSWTVRWYPWPQICFPCCHYIFQHILPVCEGRGQHSHLTAKWVLALLPRHGMFAGQSDRKPPKVTPQTGHGVVVAMPAFVTQCMWWIVTQLWVMMCTQSCYASKMIHKLASLSTYSQEAKKCQQNTAVSMCLSCLWSLREISGTRVCGAQLA